MYNILFYEMRNTECNGIDYEALINIHLHAHKSYRKSHNKKYAFDTFSLQELLRHSAILTLKCAH